MDDSITDITQDSKTELNNNIFNKLVLSIENYDKEKKSGDVIKSTHFGVLNNIFYEDFLKNIKDC